MKLLRAVHNGKTYAVSASSIVIDANASETISLTDIEFITDGTVTTDFGKRIAGTWSIDDAATSLILAYINEDATVTFEEVAECIKEFKEMFFEPLTIKDDIKVPCKYLGSFGVLNLEMVDNDKFRYYTDGDEFVLLNENGSFKTDNITWYYNELLENLEKGTYLWKSEDCKTDNE